ncbi:MAG: hypothetical protein LBP65_01885 [Puniceicoccales bacterium]|jgi:hypothetical protein|nr:hypothetical protein [Puniceicoccales bacterium]
MAFNKLYFSSISNQQVSGERIQTWQYESTDPISDLTAANYFAEMRNSLKVNDLIWVVQMDAARRVAQSRTQLTVRVNEAIDGPNAVAVTALPELSDATTTVLDFPDISATANQALPTFPAAVRVVGAYAVLLGELSGSSSLAVSVRSSDPTTVYSGTLTAPATYGAELTLTAGTADTDTAYTVTLTPTSVPANSGALRVFVQTRAA